MIFENAFLNMFDSADVPDIGMHCEQEFPVDRYIGPGPEPFYYSIRVNQSCSRAETEKVVQREIALAKKRGRKKFEWKTYDIPKLDSIDKTLERAGFKMEKPNRLMYASTNLRVEVPRGASVREVTNAEGFALLMNVNEDAFGVRAEWLEKSLKLEISQNPDKVKAYLAVVDNKIAAAAWMKVYTNVAYLFGGGTHPDLRGRGAYRALLSKRMAVARSNGIPFVIAECSPESEKILRSLNFTDAGPALRWNYDVTPAV